MTRRDLCWVMMVSCSGILDKTVIYIHGNQLQNPFTFEHKFSLFISCISRFSNDSTGSVSQGNQIQQVGGKFSAMENVGIGIKLMASVLVQVFNNACNFV